MKTVQLFCVFSVFFTSQKFGKTCSKDKNGECEGRAPPHREGKSEMNKRKQKALEFEAWKKEWVESALKNLHNDQKRKELVHEMILQITEENNEEGEER